MKNEEIIAKSKLPGVIATHLTYDQTRMISDIAASLDMSVEELATLALQDIIDIVVTPADELTDVQAAYAEHLNQHADGPISFLQYLREVEVNPELLWLATHVWVEDEADYDDKDIDVMELINSRPDMPYRHLWTDFIALRKELNMLPIDWQHEFHLIKKWIVDLKNLRGEISYV